jgi:hypothetical protein
LKEKLRVSSAIQRVSTHGVETSRDWKIELEMLNVQYELLDIKELLYLRLLRIYSKAYLDELQPFIKVKFFDESQERFKGKRVLRITENEKNLLNDDFIIDYLQKNNFQDILWVGKSMYPVELSKKLYERGIYLGSDENIYDINTIMEVPVSQFSTREDMEVWINAVYVDNKYQCFFFDKVNELIRLDSKTMGE